MPQHLFKLITVLKCTKENYLFSKPSLRFINFLYTFFSLGTNVIKSLPEFTASKFTVQLARSSWYNTTFHFFAPYL